jgi:hypothetical protein
MPEVPCIGFPIVEVAADGSCVVTKSRGTGGRVCEETVKEQLVYEIGDPDTYLSPDVTLSLLRLEVEECGNDRVAVRGARGRPAPATFKVSATYQDGFRAQGELTIFGADAAAKARRAGESVLARLAADGVSFRESLVECLGEGACRPQGIDPALAKQLNEVVLRIAVADDSRASIERFARALMPLVTAGPPGTTGYAEGRPRIHPLIRYWPCLVARDRVQPNIEVFTSHDGLSKAGVAEQCAADRQQAESVAGLQSDARTKRQCAENSKTLAPSPRRLADIAFARSGDKGINANIGVIARRPDDFARLCKEVTAARVAAYLGIEDSSRITRFELPNLRALNFVVRGILANSLRVDAQGKALGQVLLEMPLDFAP